MNVTTKEGQEVNYTDGELVEERFFGTYIHGIFDSSEFRTSLLNRLRRKKALGEKQAIDLNQRREEELEKLARVVRENIDMEYVYSLIHK